MKQSAVKAKEGATKAFYAMVGSPIVFYDKTVAMSGRLVEMADGYYDTAAEEGEKVTKKVMSTTEDLVDIDEFQDRVEKLRDQLEDAVVQWRETFRPGDLTEAAKPAPKTTTTKKPAAKKPAAKSTAAKKPAAKSTAAKKPAAKSTAAKKPATTKEAPKTDASA